MVLIDEAGALLLPLLRRSLAPRGQPAVLKHRVRRREKVSMIAALVWCPVVAQLALHWRTYPKEYVNSAKAADFVRAVLAELPGDVVVLWDGGPMHKGEPIRELLREHPRLTVERLPPYCPHFNPVEYLWSYLKYGQLANFTPADAAEIDTAVRQHLGAAQVQAELLKGFWDHCELPPLEWKLTA